MKVSCTHFQCSAGAFTYLRDHFSHNFSVDMSHQILNLNINLMLVWSLVSFTHVLSHIYVYILTVYTYFSHLPFCRFELKYQLLFLGSGSRVPVGKINVGQPEELSCCSNKCPGTLPPFFCFFLSFFFLKPFKTLKLSYICVREYWGVFTFHFKSTVCY